MNHILQFLEEWLEWAKRDAPHHYIFDPQHGLCDNLNNEWLPNSNLTEDECDNVAYKFSSMLKEDHPGENSLYPFGMDDYFKDVDNHSHHKNLNRLCWVEGKIEELSKENSNG